MHRSVLPLALALAASPALASEVRVADAALEEALRALAADQKMTVVLDTDDVGAAARRLAPEGYTLMDGRRTAIVATEMCLVNAADRGGRWTLLDNGHCAGSAEAFAVVEAPPAIEAVGVGSTPVVEAVAVEIAPAVEAAVGPVDPVAAAPAEPVAVASEATGGTPPSEPVAVGTAEPEVEPLPFREPGRFRGPGDAAMISFGTVYGAFAGGETGYLIGETFEANEAAHTYQGSVGGALAGAVVGTSLATMLAARRDYTPEEVGLLYSGAGVGGFYGAELGRALIPVGDPGDVERIHAASLAGSMAGVGIAILAADKAHGLGRQAGFALGTTVGWQTGAGLAAMLPMPRRDLNNDGVAELVIPRRRDAAIELVGATAFGGLASVANHAGIERPTPTTLALSVGHGAWIGAWSPVLFSDQPTPRAIAGGLRLGTGVGYASAIGMAALGQPSPRAAALHTAGWAAGTSLGAGIPLSLDKRFAGRQVVGPMLAGGIGGQLLGAAVAPAYAEFDANDAALLAVLESWTAYQAIGWSLWASTDEGQRVSGRPIGYAMSAAGAGTLATIAVSPRFDVSPAGSMALLSAGGWGTWAGMWGAQLAGAKPNGVWLTTLAAGNGAVLASGVAQGLGWDPSWRHLGLLNGSGLIGAAAGGLLGIVALYQEDNWKPLIGSTLAGSAVGLGVGTVFAVRSKGAHVSALPELPGLRRTGFAARLHAQPWMDDDGRPGAWVQLDLTERRD